jgi:hypothetical protein
MEIQLFSRRYVDPKDFDLAQDAPLQYVSPIMLNDHLFL